MQEEAVKNDALKTQDEQMVREEEQREYSILEAIELLDRRGLTRYQIAKDMGLSKAAFYQYTGGYAKNPSLKVVRLMWELYGIKVKTSEDIGGRKVYLNFSLTKSQANLVLGVLDLISEDKNKALVELAKGAI